MNYFIPETDQSLKHLYEDKMNILRWGDVKDPITGVTRKDTATVYSNIDCGLSFKNLYNQTENKPGYDLSTTPIIFCGPETDIQTSDILEVTTRSGRVYKLKCGEPNGYGGSHIQVTCSRYEDG